MPQRRLRDAAHSTTTRYKGAQVNFSPADLLNALGLQGADFAKGTSLPNGMSEVQLGEGSWDESTGGSVAVKTRLTVDELNRPRKLQMELLCLQPGGNYDIYKLCDIKFSPAGRNLRFGEAMLLGRPLGVINPDALARLVGALKNIHATMRQHHFPDVARIFDQYQVFPSQGVETNIPGLSNLGGFRFTATTRRASDSTEPLTLPAEFINELLGFGVNQIDNPSGSEQSQIGSHPRNGELFRFRSEVSGTPETGELSAFIAPLGTRGKKAAYDLIDMQWEAGASDAATVTVPQFRLRGEDSQNLAPLQRQRRLGIVNAINRDARQGIYPRVPDHIAKFGQHDLIDFWNIRENLGRHPQMIVVPFGGHGDREYVPGFGETIGGNSKGVFACWRDAEGTTHRKGVLIDYGSLFNKLKGIQAGEHGTFDYALPDLTGFLNDFDDILLTHLHADHMQGLIDLARCDMIRDKTVHASVYDCRVAEQFLKQAGVPKEQWPTFNPLQGNGWLHIQHAGQRVMSVFYSTNAIPHSTNVTAFAVANAPYLADDKGQPLEKTPQPNPHYWSYGSFGDMGFGVYNLPGYTGEVPLDTGFKPDFFKDFKAGLRQNWTAIPARMQPQIDRVAMVEIEATSIEQDGFGNDIITAERNWERMNRWFGDKGLQVHTLSTSKRMHELLMRVAVGANRNVTADGAYLEARWRDMNVMGVNTDVLTRHPDGGNIQKYMNLIAGIKGVVSVLHLGRASKKMKDIIAGQPEHTMMVASGTQGSEIEKDSVGSKSANGASRLFDDVKYNRAAYGANPQDYIVVYPQGAIPGNAETQLAQQRREAYDNDRIVAAAVNNGTRFFNLKEPYYSQIVSELEQNGERFTRGANGELFIHGFSIYVSGHGKKEDFRQGFLPWFKANGVENITVQHFSRHEAVRVAHGLADETALGHPAEPVSNRQVWTMEGGKTFKTLARLVPSFIFARTNRRSDKYHGGTVEYKRAIFMLDEAGTESNPAFAAMQNGNYFLAYGKGGLEEARHDSELPVLRSRRNFDSAMTKRADAVDNRGHLATRGVRNPFRGLRPVPPHIAVAGLR